MDYSVGGTYIYPAYVSVAKGDGHSQTYNIQSRDQEPHKQMHTASLIILTSKLS